MRIDCAECRMQATDACEDCVVSFLLDRPAGGVAFDAAEERALRTLSAGGLVPGPRWQPHATDPASRATG